MAKAKLTDAEFLELWTTHQSASKIAKLSGVSERQIHIRRRHMEGKLGEPLVAKDARVHGLRGDNPVRSSLGILNGTVLVFSDAHFWPGIYTTAYRGLLHMIKELKPVAIIANGDIFDGAQISRHPSIGYSSEPSVIEELKACEIAMGAIEETAKKARHNVKLVWPLGNHDARYETRLAANAPQYAGTKFFSLKDWFPAWTPCWSCWPTEDVVIKHRWKGGIHATHNNTSMSGKTMVTGHLHSLKVTPFSDYNGTRYGVDTGTLAETDGPQFVQYLEDSPTNWRSGFAVLTFHDGKLLWPELAHKFDDDHIEFRGKVIKV